MTGFDPSHAKHGFGNNYRAEDEFSGGNSSTGSGTTGSYGSHHSQLHRNKGLDMIESFFSTIFGGCCRPSHCSDGVVALVGSKNTNRNDPRSIFKVDNARRQRWEDTEQITRPPQIRRIALNDEFNAQPPLDRSESLSFLFNEGKQANSS